MSSRAVRKALRQRELAQQPVEAPEHDSDSDIGAPPPKPSLFALLGDTTEDQEEDKEPSEPEEEPSKPEPTAPKTTSRKKKKKKKAKPAATQQNEGEDEIDAALRALNLTHPTATSADARNSELKSLSEILKIDSKHFDAGNEMRRLFGRAALDGAAEEGGGGGGGRGGFGAGGRGGRKAGSGRRNMFVQAKEDWPVAGSGGLGMEMVGAGEDGTTEFRFVHSGGYQDVQRQFMMCVASMDPNRVIQLLHHNPYHISTLLQAAEIFAHQRDHTIAGTLLERALYTFGRTLHSTFPAQLSTGTARLSSLRPENREFYLTSIRYLTNLQMRGTFRTALEYARLLLSLSPLDDPYAMRLLIDFLALKSRQPEILISLISHPTLKPHYSTLPNMAYSTALAYKQLHQEDAAREHLRKAMTKFPWVVKRLYSELAIDTDLPPVLWAAEPEQGDALQPVLAALYVARSKDLWKEPEASAMLVEMAGTVYGLPKTSLLKKAAVEQGDEEEVVDGVPVSIARHVLISDIPAVTALLPRAWTRRETAGFDPLPPAEDIRSYNVDIPDTAPGAVEEAEGARPGLLEEFIRSFFPHLDRGQMPGEEEVRRVFRERGIDLEPGDFGLAREGEGGEGEGEGDGEGDGVPRVRLL